MVEIPPKLITKLARQVASFRFFRLLKLRQPFVISITPFKKAERCAGSSEKMGEKHSIIIKKIVIIVPTESIAVVEERTMLPRSKEEFSLKKSLFCEKFTFYFVPRRPFCLWISGIFPSSQDSAFCITNELTI